MNEKLIKKVTSTYNLNTVDCNYEQCTLHIHYNNMKIHLRMTFYMYYFIANLGHPNQDHHHLLPNR